MGINTYTNELYVASMDLKHTFETCKYVIWHDT